MIEIIILAAIAGFLFLRLREVLGTKTGHENPDEWVKTRTRRPDPREDHGSVVTFPGAQHPAAPAHEDIAEVVELESPTGQELVAAKEFEPEFDALHFLDGARYAYEMILMAFETGDKETLRPLLAPDVYESFAAAIDDRKEKGYTVDARFVGIRAAKIVEAKLERDSRKLDIGVRFDADMIITVRDTQGEIVEGDPVALRRMNDLWSFRRELGASDPSWLLVETA